MIKKFVLVLVSLVIGGCLTKPPAQEPLIEISSTNSGVIKLNYRYSFTQSSVINWVNIENSATKLCQDTGYFGLVPQKQVPTNCDRKFSNEICKQWRVEISYQCT